MTKEYTTMMMIYFQDIAGSLLRITEFLNTNVPDNLLRDIIQKCSFDKMLNDRLTHPDSYGIKFVHTDDSQDLKPQVDAQTLNFFFRKGDFIWCIW